MKNIIFVLCFLAFGCANPNQIKIEKMADQYTAALLQSQADQIQIMQADRLRNESSIIKQQKDLSLIITAYQRKTKIPIEALKNEQLPFTTKELEEYNKYWGQLEEERIKLLKTQNEKWNFLLNKKYQEYQTIIESNQKIKEYRQETYDSILGILGMGFINKLLDRPTTNPLQVDPKLYR